MTNRLFARIGLGIAFTTVLGTAATVPASAAPAAARTAVVKGQVFADANSNVRADPGEGLRGATVKLDNFDNGMTYRITTGVNGRFRAVLPTGQYYLSGGKVRKHTRWKIINQGFHLRADGRDFSLRAVRPLGRVLKAELHFTADVYHPGDRLHVVLTLTNTGSKVLRGIGAECNHVGDPNELENRGPGWGKLGFDGPGVGLAPHATRTFVIHDNLPAAAQRFGQVEVACDFGYPVSGGHRASAFDTAKVPGEFGAIAGDVGRYRHNKLIGLAHVHVVLVDTDTCPIYKRKTTSDRHGHFRIGHVPAGSAYLLYLYPPEGWKIPRYNPSPTKVFGNDTVHLGAEVVHGSKHVPDPPSTC